MTGRIITIAQQKGGAGKTTLAAILAVAFAKSGAKVAVIDSDPQTSLSHWHRLRVTHQIAPALTLVQSSPWGLSYEADKLRRSHDFVVIDTPPRADSDLRPSLRAADLVLVPLGPSPLDLWACEGVLDLAARETARTSLVLTRLTPRSKLLPQIEAEAANLHGKILTARLGQRSAYAEAMGRGMAGQELASPPARAEAEALRQEIIKTLERNG